MSIKTQQRPAQCSALHCVMGTLTREGQGDRAEGRLGGRTGQPLACAQLAPHSSAETSHGLFSAVKIWGSCCLSPSTDLLHDPPMTPGKMLGSILQVPITGRHLPTCSQERRHHRRAVICWAGAIYGNSFNPINVQKVKGRFCLRFCLSIQEQHQRVLEGPLCRLPWLSPPCPLRTAMSGMCQ